MIVNPRKLVMWSTRNKCFMCKRRFEKPFLLPVEKPQKGKFEPNFNVDAIWHVQDTHGIPHTTTRKWIIGSIYNLELNEFGAKGLEKIYNDQEV